MRRLLLVLVALTLPASRVAAETFTYHLTFPNGIPGVMHARVDKAGEKHNVNCEYLVSQEEEMGLPDMPLASWRLTDVEKADRDTVRALCLKHYDEALPRE